MNNLLIIITKAHNNINYEGKLFSGSRLPHQHVVLVVQAN